MPEVDYVVLSEWFDWIIRNIDVSIDLIGKAGSPCPFPGGSPGCSWSLFVRFHHHDSFSITVSQRQAEFLLPVKELWPWFLKLPSPGPTMSRPLIYSDLMAFLCCVGGTETGE